MKDAEAVTFAGGTLDRAAHLRGDAEVQAALRADPRARGLALWRGRPLLAWENGRPRLAWLPLGAGPLPGAPAIFLGLAPDRAPRFALDVLADWRPEGGGPRPFFDARVTAHPVLPPGLGFGDLRAVMGALTHGEAGDAAAAKGIFAWHHRHTFCANCGARSEAAEAGWRRACPACGAQHFPRTDPVVIMLVLCGNSVLLGRSASWPEGIYSLLAGFMEPGESIEAAVRRETWEEAGVRISRVDYLASQPWPFPSSLMIGCRGEAMEPTIRRDPDELEDARWVSRESLLTALACDDPKLRPARSGSIARFLIERWLSDRLV